MKKGLAFVLTAAFCLAALTGCGKNNSADPYTGTLILATWDNNLYNFIEEYEIVEKFQEHYPNIEIEIEKVKGDSEYWDAMKMRSSANQLPDIMFNKTFTLSRFKDYLLDLSETTAAKDNELAAGYAVNGKILGVPTTSGYEYVYYWKDIFAAAGVEVPTTWNEFVEAGVKLQNYYEASDPDFMALALGMKDEWPNYPFMEFMPSLESGNGQNWNTMATQDAPFAEGEENSLLDVLVNEDAPIVDRALVVESLRTEIQSALNSLSVRERQVIEAFYGINQKEMSLEEIGIKYGLTRERVRQIKEKAIRRLRLCTHNRILKTYLG